MIKNVILFLSAIPSGCLYLLPDDGRRCWYFDDSAKLTWIEGVRHTEGLDGRLLSDNDTALYTAVSMELTAYLLADGWWTGLRRRDLDNWIWNHNLSNRNYDFL